MSQVLTIDNRDYIPAGMVGKHFGYTRDYILTLARDGKIDGRKIGHRWFVNLDSAEKFFEEAKAHREERRQVVREVRRTELRTHEGRRGAVTRKSRGVEVLAIVVIGLVIGMAGFVGSSATPFQQALSYSSDAPFLEKLAVSLYNFISPDPQESGVVREDTSVTEEPTTSITEPFQQEEQRGATATKTVHTSLVIGPGEVLTTTAIESIRDSLSDDVSVSVDPHNPDTGIIVPHFKNKDGEEYRFLLVPAITTGSTTDNE